jgi:hypothetical protein
MSVLSELKQQHEKVLSDGDLEFDIGYNHCLWSFVFWSIMQVLFVWYSVYKCCYEIDRTQAEAAFAESKTLWLSSIRPPQQYSWSIFRSEDAESLEPASFDQSAEEVKNELIQLLVCPNRGFNR